MARVLVTGSADGLGLMAARLLTEQGHSVVLHARHAERGHDARDAVPEAEGVVVGDLATLHGVRAVAEQANDGGHFDAVIHNAGIGYRERQRTLTEDGVEHVFAVNVLAPYLLTCLVDRPGRLVYLSSGMHFGGGAALDDLSWERRRWNGAQAYSDSKLYDAVLAAAVARRWPDVLSNSVEPGWVPTKMGGPGAPDDLEAGAVTQAWLAVSDEPAARVSGRYFFHRAEREAHPAVHDTAFQDELLSRCAELTSTPLPD